jgi:hypothetical protein
MEPAEVQEHRPTADTFAERAAALSPVRDVAIDEARVPPRVNVDINATHIPEAVHDLLDRFQADIEDAATGATGLRLTVTVPTPWKDAGTRTVREQGNSFMITLPQEALDAAALGQERVALHARDGEIHVKRHDGGPRFP